MALNALPILVINLGGEMMYILDQRLKAQNIPKDKGDKVVNDIVKTMFDRQFMDEIFKPQQLYSKSALRSLFEKIAHASIMKLNTPSMDKLYDLMTMVFKYQVYLCPMPLDLLSITLNHLDAIRNFVITKPNIASQVDFVNIKLMETYQNLSLANFQLLRFTLLNFFQDLRIRVSIFIKEGIQHQNARFKIPSQGTVPYGFEVPGTIREYGSDVSLLSETFFLNGGNYLPSDAMNPDQPSTTLGTNIYTTYKDAGRTEYSIPSPQTNYEEEEEEREIDNHAQKQLDLMARLIGKTQSEMVQSDSHFSISMFGNGNDENVIAQEQIEEEERIININISKPTQQNMLDKIIADLGTDNSEEKAKGDDNLLELMDYAS
ncbi:protein OSCP1 isoform X2 [Centruroides vittatus]